MINQKRAVEWELTMSEAVVFSWLYELPSWADKLVFNNETYYFGSRTIACKELPLVTDKTDTMYRIYKSLEKKGLIAIIVLQSKDYIALTAKGKEWHYDVLPTDGKISDETRKNFRDNSEKNPTYKYINNQYISNNNSNVKEDSKKSDKLEFIDRMYNLYPTKCPKRGCSLGKSYKDKDKLKKLLKQYTEEEIEMVILHEIDEKYGKQWMSNFSTFLNNFPDPKCLDEGKTNNNMPNTAKEDILCFDGVEYQ